MSSPCMPRKRWKTMALLFSTSRTSVLTGTIVERQKDHKTDETKIVIRGLALDGREAEAVVKVGLSGILYIITVYAT